MLLNDLYHALDPVAFSLGPFTVRWYALAYLAGFVLAGRHDLAHAAPLGPGALGR